MSNSSAKLIRPLVHALHAYVPGEQPKIRGLIKLNTNENPFPPSPKVLAAVKSAVDGRLRLYPHPTAEKLRMKLARLHACAPENIIIGNGSDELLALAVRTFVEPATNAKLKNLTAKNAAATVQYFIPSYSLYPVLAETHGALKNAVPLNQDFSMPDIARLRRGQKWNFNAGLTLITTPNAPSGRGYQTPFLEKLCRAQKGVVVLDEAYVDFANGNALKLALAFPHVLVARTFSKAYSLCFQRVGYFVGHADLIAALDKMRDSYNVNGLGQIAAEATLDDLKYYRRNFEKIIATREWLARQLTKCGFRVLPSQTNFILARPPAAKKETGNLKSDPAPSAQAWLQELRAKKILVRWFSAPEVRNYLRITIGTPAEAAALVKAVQDVMRDA